MRFPDFLIIGAMKAGTTSLYRDLLENPAIYMPDVKEPNSLCRDQVLEADGLAEYAALFEAARPSQKCGEASTTYTKLPDRTGAAERARKVIGPNLRVIYIVREPVARIISHHYHSYVTGLFGPNIDEEIHRQPSLLNYTKYAMQVTPWIELFGHENVMIVKFEEYVARRREVVAKVSEFIGVEPRPDLIDLAKVYNKSDGKPVRVEFWRAVRLSRTYRKVIAPLLPRHLRDRIRDAVHPKAPPRPDPPSDATIRFIYASLAMDQATFGRIARSHSPLWPVPDLRQSQETTTQLS